MNGCRNVKPQLIKKENIKKILEYLPFFENPGEIYLGTDNDDLMSGPDYSNRVEEFIQCLYQEGMIQPFDWGKWQDEVKKYVDYPSLIETADLLTIQKLFTTHVRKERFYGGHFGQMIENGHILALLKRLKILLNDLD